MRIVLCGLAIAAIAAVAGCGGGDSGEVTSATTNVSGEEPAAGEAKPKKLEEVRITLDGWEGPATLGLLMAEENGYFADAGLKTEILVSSPGYAMRYAGEETVDLAVVHQPQVVMAKEKGAPVVAVGSLIPAATAALMWLPGSKIEDVGDLKGKTIAIPGLRYQRSFLETILASGGLTLRDVRLESVGYDVLPALASGRADAIFGGSSNLEGAALESRGLNPIVKPVAEFGIPNYDELVVVAVEGFASEHPQALRAFISAVRRGVRAAINDPEAALEAVVLANEGNPDLSEKTLRAEVEATLPLLSKSAFLSPRRTTQLVDWMRAEGMIQRKVPTSALLTNAYG